MYIIQVASEMTPVAKVGGLADVVYGLTRELERQGHAVEVILPKYDCMKYDQVLNLQPIYNDLWVPWFGGSIHCTVFSGLVHHVKCLFIDPHGDHHFFNRGNFYGGGEEYYRWAFFCRAALEFMLKTNRRPEVIHCHDWQTGLLSVMLYEIYAHLGMGNQRVCYTVHNFKHQGHGPADVLNAAGLGRHDYFYSPQRLRDHSKPKDINFMKGGIVYSNYCCTVSPHHAWEAQNTGFGFGLNSVLHQHHGKFGGILNGLDYEQWNPGTDWALPAKYTVDNFQDKFKNKKALRERFMLRDDFKPLFGYVGRLDDQKGLHLIKHALYWALRNNAQFALLGTGQPNVNGEFGSLKRQLNDNPDCHLEIGYDEGLAHLMYAGLDYLVVPSVFEPCGLAQMIALRYGTPPIVRYTGGLADTVFDWDHDGRPREERNGFVFQHDNAAALESALTRANGLFYSPDNYYRQLAIQGMKCDFSWREPAKHYVNVYEHIRHK